MYVKKGFNPLSTPSGERARVRGENVFRLNKKNSQGISLVEVMLTLIVASIILMMVTRYFKQANDGQRVNSAISMIQKIHKSTQQYAQSYNYDPEKVSISFFQDNRALSRLYDENPWKGDINAAVKDNVLTVILTGVPGLLCVRMVDRLKTTVTNGQDTYACGGKGGGYTGSVPSVPSGVDPSTIPDGAQEKIDRKKVTFTATLQLY
jgi:Tfp pilus assembly protein FimT